MTAANKRILQPLQPAACPDGQIITPITQVCNEPLVDSYDVSDESLLGDISNGQSESLGLLFKRYNRLVRRVAERILRDSSEAEDVVQDLFIFVQSKCSVFDRSKSSARSWLIQMTYQKALDRRRYLTIRQFYRAQNARTELDNVVSNPTGEVDYSPEAIFDRNGLKKAIDQMSQEQRETLRLYFFEGYTLAEISRKLGKPIGNVRHFYYRGLDKLRMEMCRGNTGEG